MKSILVLLLTVIGSLYVSGLNAETATEGSAEIARLYAAENFEQLLTERYAEIHKAESQADIGRLVAPFKNRFADENRLNGVIEFYERASKVTPEIIEIKNPQVTETETMAIFKIDGAEIKLYLLKTGKWGFHL